MVIRLDELDCETTEKPRGGKGIAECFPYKAMHNLNVKMKTFNMMNLTAGSAIGVHKHEHDMEGYLILDGTAKYCDNGTETTLESGDLALCYKGEIHSIEANNGDVTFLAFIMEQY